MITKQQDKELQQLGYTGDVAMDIDKAIRWLREVKGVHVAILYNRISNVWDYIVYYLDNTLSATGYPFHDHAQSAGLDTAIEYVKKQQI
jgi:hypothetical protein